MHCLNQDIQSHQLTNDDESDVDSNALSQPSNSKPPNASDDDLDVDGNAFSQPSNSNAPSLHHKGNYLIS